MTFGFELEGAFAQLQKPKWKGRLKYDGSVDESEARKLLEREGVIATGQSEYESPVFNSKKELLQDLRTFIDGVTFSTDLDSCGLHLHIGETGRRIKRLRNAMMSLRFQHDAHAYLKNRCGCQHERLTGEQAHWCRLPKTSWDLIGNAHDEYKYQFMRFHPQGTLEFRGFAPCEHRNVNVAMFIDYVMDYINGASSEVVKANAETVKETMNIGGELTTKLPNGWQVTRQGTYYRLTSPHERLTSAEIRRVFHN